MKKIILVNGKATAGKDTFYKYVKENYLLHSTKKCVRMAFADELKKYLLERGWNGKKDEEGRKLLQYTGDNLKSRYGQDYFANIILEEIDESDADIIIITDWRYENEYKIIKSKYDVVTVHINRIGLVPNDTHSSENSLDNFNFDYIIINSGKKDFIQVIEDIIFSILEQ